MNNNDLTANHLSRKTEEQQTQDDNEQRINKRTKWTLEMNIDVARCYYEALKDPEATTYRKNMYNNWLKIYPNSQITEQRLCDQNKQIQDHANPLKQPKTNRGNWLTNTQIEKIKAEINKTRMENNTNEENLNNNNIQEIHQGRTFNVDEINNQDNNGTTKGYANARSNRRRK